MNAYTAITTTATCKTTITVFMTWGTTPYRVGGHRPKRRLRAAFRQLGVDVLADPDYFWVTFLAGAFLATAFLAGAFLAGAFLAGAFLASAFLRNSMPTSLAARSPTARVCEATAPSASWVSSTAWST